jgi:hypothetical protein
MSLMEDNTRKLRSAGLLTLMLLSLGSQLVAQARTRDLTQAEAHELVYQALDASARKLPKLAFDFYDKPDVPDFYMLAVTWDNPTGSVMVGHFAVNRVTGEVWRLVVCKKLESVDLKRLQKTMQKRIGVSTKELHAFERKVPCEP